MIPDVPYAIKEQIKREKYLTQVILHETNLKLVTKRIKTPEDEIREGSVHKLSAEELDFDWCNKNTKYLSMPVTETELSTHYSKTCFDF